MTTTPSPLAQQLDPRDDIVWPVAAILIAAAGFWLFGGASSSTTVNGEVTSESSVNLLGLVLAAVAVAIAVRALRSRGGAKPVRRGLAVVAILVAVAQAVYTVLQF
ncbi:MAG TPA: hypothetical protein VGE77_02575 [Nocardioides sp.]